MAYGPEFLGFTLPLPTAGPSRAGAILRRSELADGVTDAEKRPALRGAHDRRGQETKDAEALKDKQGRLRYDFQKYQVTIREIEIATGLEFPDEVYERNPLFFYESDAAYAAGARIFPERFDVDVPRDLIRNSGDRYAVLDDVVDVYIAAASVKPANGHREWVTLMNLGATDVDVSRWTLRDR